MTAQRAVEQEAQKPWRMSTFECEMLLRWFLAHLDMETRRSLMRELPVYYNNLVGRGPQGGPADAPNSSTPTVDECTVAYRLATSAYGTAGACRVAVRLIQSIGIPCVVRGNEQDGWRIVLGVPDPSVKDPTPADDDMRPVAE